MAIIQWSYFNNSGEQENSCPKYPKKSAIYS